MVATRLASLPCSSLSRSCCGPASTSAPSAAAAALALPRRHREHPQHRRRLSASTASSSSPSSGEPSDASPSPAPSSTPQMSLAEAHAALGVSEGSQFDLVSAKNRALADAKGDGERLAKIELAYDKLLMNSMARRLSGEAPVEASVRYADLRVPPRRGPGSGSGSPGGSGGSRGGGGGGGGTGIKKGTRSSSRNNTRQISLGSLPIALAAPPTDLATKQAAAFVGLAAWALAQGVTEPAAAAAVDTASLQLAAALGLSIWFLADAKRLPLRTAALVSLGALAAGAVAGGGLAAWLRPDIVPLGPLASPGVLVAEAAIAALWAAAAFVV